MSARRKIGIAAILLGAAAIVAALVMLAPDLYDEWRYKQLADSVVGDHEQPEGDLTGAKAGPAIDWDELKETNPDIVAWVQVEGTNIDYPVVKREGDNQYYLNHSFWGDYSASGCPYLDYRSPSADSGNALVYGHHMGSSGAVFDAIFDTYEQEAFDNVGTIWWCTPDGGNRRIHPICAMNVYETYAPIQQFEWEPSEEQIAEAKARYLMNHGWTDDAGKSDEVNSNAKDIYLKPHADEIMDDAESIAFKAWLRMLVDDASAKESDEDIERDIAKSDRVVTLATCSSVWAGQPWRTLLVCVPTE